MTSDPIVVTQTFSTSVDMLWQAITDPAVMRQWYFEPIQHFEPVVGFESEFDVAVEAQVFGHRWKVTEVVPLRKISYEWRYEGIPGSSEVSFDIEATKDACSLTVTHTGYETFPQDDPMFHPDAVLSGWQYLICESLYARLK